MEKNLNEIKLATGEEQLTKLENIRVEMKGLGPTVQVLKKTRILVTNLRIVIAQKALFSSSYRIRYMIWLDAEQEEKLHFFNGSIATGISPDSIQEIDQGRQKVTKFGPKGSIEYIHVFCEISQLKIT